MGGWSVNIYWQNSLRKYLFSWLINSSLWSSWKRAVLYKSKLKDSWCRFHSLNEIWHWNEKKIYAGIRLFICEWEGKAIFNFLAFDLLKQFSRRIYFVHSGAFWLHLIWRESQLLHFSFLHHCPRLWVQLVEYITREILPFSAQWGCFSPQHHYMSVTCSSFKFLTRCFIIPLDNPGLQSVPSLLLWGETSI